MLYKLTDQLGQTRNQTQWGPNVTHKATGDPSQPLCSDGWIHAYESPEVAVFMNPAHGNFADPRLWEAEGRVGKRDGELKCGCRALTTLREIPLPVITAEQRVKIAIRCALRVYTEPGFVAWAGGWLSGKDRTEAAAEAEAAAAAEAAAWAARAAARAAEAAAAAARAAARAAAWAAAWTAAAWAAEVAAAWGSLPLIAIIREVLERDNAHT